MDDIAKRIANLSPEKRALLELKLNQKKGIREPIAIIGIGCRFPGAPNLGAFWQLLQNGVDAITEVPPERWDINHVYDQKPEAQGKTYCRWGGFLEQVDQFDPEFFGIAPREATYIDPQQRLLLEVVWEALEDAGQVPSQLSGSKTGVFVGLSTNDYGQLLLRGPDVIDTYTNTGVAATMVANRVSYLLNFRGPSLAIDTACSSSLVAIHLACQSLWQNETTLALAGGVNLILTPSLTVGFSKLTALSPDGRCKAFDAEANGFVRGEGAGMVVLKPLSAAIADKDPVYALIRGSAVNQDGRSNGLTAPNREAQEAVLKAAYDHAGIAPNQVQYVEAHGTGTLLGDPIEAMALGQVLSRDRAPNTPVRIGSVKSNIGHTEAAAGIASVIKVALCLKHQQLVPSLHFNQPNPHIPFDQLPLKVQQTCEPWPENTQPAIAGISSFGFGGSNSHVVLEAAPDLSTPPPSSERPLHLLTLSAKSDVALKELAQKYATSLVELADNSLANLCFTTNTGRSHFGHRLAVMGSTSTQLAKELENLAKTLPIDRASTPHTTAPKVTFLFTGQGSQYPNMGRQLYETQPIFRQALERCDEILKPHLEYSLLEVLYPQTKKTESNSEFRTARSSTGSIANSELRTPNSEFRTPNSSLLHQTAYTQPALFALEYALSELWRSWGIVPDAVLGHSVGEYVAACVAGVFSLEDGLALIAERGRLMQTLPADGMMAAVFADQRLVEEVIATHGETVAIATLNGPDNTVISGEQNTVTALLEKLQEQGVDSKPLQVSHAFHSPLMEPILDRFEQRAARVRYAPPQIPFFSNLTGTTLTADEFPDAHYWRRHTREPVRFATGIESLAAQGYSVFVEVGPTPVLTRMGQRCLPESHLTWLLSLRKNQDNWQSMLSSLASLYQQGVDVDWASFDRPYPRRRVSSPTYSFQRSRYWVDIPVLPSPTSNGEATVSPGSKSIDDWFYHITWQLKPLPNQGRDLGSSVAAAQDPGSWLILTDKKGVGANLVDQLKHRGEVGVFVAPGPCYASLGDHQYQVNPESPEDFQTLLQEITQSQFPSLKGVVHLWSLDTPFSGTETARSLITATAMGCRSALNLLQALVQTELSTQLWLVTQAAQPCALETHSIALSQVPLWGLGRTASHEHPELWGGLIDLDYSEPQTLATTLLTQFDTPDGEDQIALRDGKRYVARLSPHPQPPTEQSALQLREEGTYLITGGLGGLGLKVAQWMVKHGAKHLVLVSRNATLDAEKQALLTPLRDLGAKVIVKSADVTQSEAVASLIQDLETTLPPLRGVIHAAGILDDGVLMQMDWDRFSPVLAPKVEGAWNLHHYTQTAPLDFFVLFSSAAALLGPPGQANYAAANLFLDALAHYRHQQGQPALSINWSVWSEVGLGVGQETDRRLALQGVTAIEPPQGLRVFEQLLQQPDAQVGVLPFNWSTLVAQLPAVEASHFLDNVAGEALQDRRQQENAPQSSPLLPQLLAAQPAAREQQLQQYLQQQVAQALGRTAEISLTQNIMDLGLDSLMVLDILNACKRDLQLVLYPREFYERPVISTLAAYLSGEIERVHNPSSTAPAPPPPSDQALGWSNVPTRSYTKPEHRNPGIVFLLSSPRSGSTLLRVMLAGHPDLFAPPELHLLPFESMAEWHHDLALSYLDEGLQRAFMELMALDAEASKQLLEDWIEQDLSIQTIYAKLQALAGTRQLVDKSPTYASQNQVLHRAEDLFEDSKYIHLVRHPYAVIESLVRNRMDKILGLEGGDPYLLAEHVWTQSNQNVLNFRQQVGAERHHLIHYETLVTQPEREMERLCQFLDIPFKTQLLQPYDGQRMTDGVYATSMAINDPNFLKHNKIDPTLAQAWQQIQLPRPLGDLACQVAKELQYDLPHQPSVPVASARPTLIKTDGPLRREFDLNANGLRLRLCSWGPETGPLILGVHGILEHGAAWEGVAQPLAEQGYRVVVPDQRGHGCSEHIGLGGTYQLLDYLADLDAVVPQLTDQPLTLVGHSMGSAVAATFASVRSERVASLVLVEPILPAENTDKDTVAQLTNHLDYLASPPQHPLFEDASVAAERLRRSTPSMSEAVALQIAQRLTESCEGGVHWRWDPRLQIRTGLGFSGTAFSRTRYLQLLRQLQVPVTLVYGEASNFNKPEDIALQQDALPHAKKVTLPGEHNVPIAAPEVLAAVIADIAP